jgi:hypothetical protein
MKVIPRQLTVEVIMCKDYVVRRRNFLVVDLFDRRPLSPRPSDAQRRPVAFVDIVRRRGCRQKQLKERLHWRFAVGKNASNSGKN